MPTYTAINKKSQVTKELFMGISEMEEWKLKNKGWEILCGAPLIHGGGGLGLKSVRNDEDFKSRINQIKKKFPRNTINNYV